MPMPQAANPFYVEPGSAGMGLQKYLQGTVGRATEDKRNMALQKASQLMQSGNMKELMVFAMQNPFIIDDVNNMMESQARLQKLQQPAKWDTDRYKVVGGRLVDVGAEGGPEVVIEAQAKAEAGKTTEKIRNFEYYEKLLEGDPLGAARFAEITRSEYSSSPLKKLIGERDVIEDERRAAIAKGERPDSPTVKELDSIIEAYDNKISGVDIDIEDMTQDEIDTWGAWVNLTGKMPSLGRGKQSTKIRVAIAKSAAQQALGSKQFGEEDRDPERTPAEAALAVIGSQADTKAIQGSLNFLEKQLSAMGSFVDNIDMQIEKVTELSRDLKTFDTRLLNIPLRIIRGRIIGSPLQAKYDLYLTEIESEIGKLATGSAASIAELSTTAQEKWDRIHDKNLSVTHMLELLAETRDAARMRQKSVQTQMDLARTRMRTRVFTGGSPAEISTQEEYDKLPSGTAYLQGGIEYRKR